jgi:hypothetical protein
MHNEFDNKLMSDPASKAPPSKHDARGRFVLGNPGGPGNPYIRRIGAFRRAMLATVTEDDFKAILSVLVKRARKGDIEAARMVLALEQPAPRLVDAATPASPPSRPAPINR